MIPYLHHYLMFWSNPVYCNIFLTYLKGGRSGSYFFHKIVRFLPCAGDFLITHFRMAAMAQIDFSIMGVYNDHNRLLPDFEGKN